MRIEHPELGTLHFSDGKQDPLSPRTKPYPPMWVCEPDPRNSDFELLIPGDAQGPQNLELALAAFHHRKTIEEQGQRRGTWKLRLTWIDLTQTPTTACFTDDDETYTLWTALLDTNWQITKFTKGNW
jgi:hypothetical protein